MSMTDVQLILLIDTIALCLACLAICVLLAMWLRLSRKYHILALFRSKTERIKNIDPFNDFDNKQEGKNIK
jgi:hypothetical protein